MENTQDKYLINTITISPLMLKEVWDKLSVNQKLELPDITRIYCHYITNEFINFDSIN